MGSDLYRLAGERRRIELERAYKQLHTAATRARSAIDALRNGGQPPSIIVLAELLAADEDLREALHESEQEDGPH